MAEIVQIGAKRTINAKSVEDLGLEPVDPPEGPFKVTISSEHGVMFEVEFPDFTGQLPQNGFMTGTVGCDHILANLLAGALRTFLGAR